MAVSSALWAEGYSGSIPECLVWQTPVGPCSTTAQEAMLVPRASL